VCLLLAVFVGSSMAQRQAAAAPRELPAVANIWEQCGGRSCVKGDCRDTAWAETKYVFQPAFIASISVEV